MASPTGSPKRHRLAPAAVLALCGVLAFGVGSGAGFATFDGTSDTTVPDTTFPSDTTISNDDTTVPDTTFSTDDTTIPDTTVPDTTFFTDDTTIPDTTFSTDDTTIPDTTVPDTTSFDIPPDFTFAPTDDTEPAGLDVNNLASDLLCADLVSQGFDYADAYKYWENEGRPARMDEDGNGVPCESRYSPREINDFLGLTGADTFQGVERGKLCRDLQAVGFTYADAYRYWVWDGEPTRMDQDGNSVPCETVFDQTEIASFFT